MKYILLRFVGIALTVALVTLPGARSADAHLATFGSWEITREYLQQLFPGATKFLVKKDEYSEAQVKAIEKHLGFSLYPEDRTPQFYVAVKEQKGKRKVLGVAMFIDPRLQPKILDGATVTLEVGVAVDARGKIHRIRVFDYRGNLALTRPAFLDQFVGMKLGDTFDLERNSSLRAVPGEEAESQLVANAAYEALYLMKTSLGTK